MAKMSKVADWIGVSAPLLDVEITTGASPRPGLRAVALAVEQTMSCSSHWR